MQKGSYRLLPRTYRIHSMPAMVALIVLTARLHAPGLSIADSILAHGPPNISVETPL